MNSFELYFSETVIDKKRKEIKAKVLSDHKGSLIVDMGKNFDPSSNTSQYVPCDTILVFHNSATVIHSKIEL